MDELGIEPRTFRILEDSSSEEERNPYAKRTLYQLSQTPLNKDERWTSWESNPGPFAYRRTVEEVYMLSERSTN